MPSSPLDKLIDELGKLPGIGRRTAERLAIHVQAMDAQDARALVAAIEEVKAKLRQCSKCGNLAESDPCSICSDARRDQAVICVVENPQDVRAFEKGGDYRGVYHVLGGRMSPLRGIGPEDLNMAALLNRLRGGGVSEVILATNPDLEGEMTAAYLAREIEALGVPATRIGQGIQVGGSLEFADQRTLQKALQARRRMD